MENQFDQSVLNRAMNTFLNNTADYIFIKGTDLTYQAASEAVAAVAGLSKAAELIGKDDYAVFPKDFADKYRKDDLQVFSGNDVQGVIERLPDQNGEERWTQTWKYAIRDDQGTIIGMYGISRDVTHTIRLENEAQIAKDYIDLINNIPGGVGLLHAENGGFCLDYANDGYFHTHHITKDRWDKIRGEQVMNFVHEEDRDGLMREYDRISSGNGKQGNAVYRVLGSGNEWHWVNIRFRRAYIKDGTQYYYASFTGMDELKKAERQLLESQNTLKEAIAFSNIQYFTYFPAARRAEIYARNSRMQAVNLPVIWDNYPDSFLKYTNPSEQDAELFRQMIERINRGDPEAGCTVRLCFGGTFLWEKVQMTAVRDSKGRITKAQAYAIDITEQKRAEDRLRKEQMRLKSLDGNLVEAFSFNLTQNNEPNLQYIPGIHYDETIDPEIVQEADRLLPVGQRARPEIHAIMLAVLNQIPDARDRELFVKNCSASAIRNSGIKDQHDNTIEYRRRIGDTVRWVATRIEVLPEPESGDKIVFFYTRDIHEAVVYRKITERIIESNYEAVTYYDKQSGRMYYYTGSEREDNGRLRSLPYLDAVQQAVDMFVLPSERESVEKKFQMDDIILKLETNPVYSIFYTSKIKDTTVPGNLDKRMKCDVFYLDENRDVIVLLQSNVTAIYEQDRENREKMADALLAAEQASVAKTEFLSRMSHEIRTPMNAIIGLDAIALQEADLSSAMEDHLQKIGISARFLLSLINDILDMSRIESGRMMLKQETFRFEELIDSINTILYEQCRDSELDYECILKSYTENAYVGDRTKLQQVLVNVLGNAVKFTPKGGKVHFMIEQISRTKEKARLRFEVSDTGIGMDEDFLPHLFEPFSQGNRGRTSVYGGTGLGLSISKNIVSLMGGNITVHSIKNVGSEFTIEVELGLTRESISRKKLLKPDKPLFTLVVDDDVIVCRHTQMMLEEAGLKTEWIDSGAGAVEKVSEQHAAGLHYDLILLDWKMPDMDGIETAREIRKIVGPEVTIIIMTAYDWADIEKRARAAGVDMFMKKPVFASSVTAAFENVFYHKKQMLEPTEPKDYDFSGKRVLLAEDNEINAEIVRRLLEMKKCKIDVVSNGAEAIEAFTTSSVGYYDAILMDVRMPVMDGLEASRTIRAMKKADSKIIPIIAMTANAFQEDINMSLKNGMNAHLAKPIDPVAFYETLYRYIFPTD